MKSHCLIKFANEKYAIDTSKSNSVIFNALYEEGKNVSLVDVLVQIAKDDLGLPENEVREYLENEEGESAVNDEIRIGRRKYKISGVPFFIICTTDEGDRAPYGLSGAQKHQTFVNLFEELSES
mmetsp:Transcript_4043/g.5275  ORF Transcript_4043/g.5275 Transcript_4043/m.5275 type:complete len:124 (+) Transcript_4043:493-864(+)